jgi:hypothetical protein
MRVLFGRRRAKGVGNEGLLQIPGQRKSIQDGNVCRSEECKVSVSYGRDEDEKKKQGR